MLDRPFTIESGEITPSMKVKRKFIEERYQDLIEQMYKSLERSNKNKIKDLQVYHIPEGLF
jgi:long-subunit acyl-CoA synthetase (AMP-forming)